MPLLSSGYEYPFCFYDCNLIFNCNKLLTMLLLYRAKCAFYLPKVLWLNDDNGNRQARSYDP